MSFNAAADNNDAAAAAATGTGTSADGDGPPPAEQPLNQSVETMAVMTVEKWNVEQQQQSGSSDDDDAKRLEQLRSRKRSRRCEKLRSARKDVGIQKAAGRA